MFNRLKKFLNSNIWRRLDRNISKIFHITISLSKDNPLFGEKRINIQQKENHNKILEDSTQTNNTNSEFFQTNNEAKYISSFQLLSAEFLSNIKIGYSPEEYKEELLSELLEEINSIIFIGNDEAKYCYIFLLAILNSYTQQDIKNNQIKINNSLENEFKSLINKYTQSEKRIEVPFFLLINSGFYFHKVIQGKEQQYNNIDIFIISKEQILQYVEYAYVDEKFLVYFYEDSYRQIILDSIILNLKKIIDQNYTYRSRINFTNEGENILLEEFETKTEISKKTQDINSNQQLDQNLYQNIFKPEEDKTNSNSFQETENLFEYIEKENYKKIQNIKSGQDVSLNPQMDLSNYSLYKQESNQGIKIRRESN